MHEMSEPALVALRPALALVGGLSESTVRRLIAEGRFPKPVVLSRTRSGRPCRVAFVRGELTAWVAATIARARANPEQGAAQAERRSA